MFFLTHRKLPLHAALKIFLRISRLAAFLACACSFLSAAENGIADLRNFSPKEYGGAVQVFSALQDRRGVMYFGLASAVLEYDGVTWRKIPLPASSAGLSLALESAGKATPGRIWVGGVADFGSLEPDANGTPKFVSLAGKIPADQRGAFGSIFRVVATPRATFFQSRQRLFRWDGNRMQVWASKTNFEALSEVRGHVYTVQIGIGLQEIVGDELRDLPGGDAYKNSNTLLLYPYGNDAIFVSARLGALTIYDHGKVTPFVTGADEYFKKTHIRQSFPLPGVGSASPR